MVLNLNKALLKFEVKTFCINLQKSCQCDRSVKKVWEALKHRSVVLNNQSATQSLNNWRRFNYFSIKIKSIKSSNWKNKLNFSHIYNVMHFCTKQLKNVIRLKRPQLLFNEIFNYQIILQPWINYIMIEAM